MLLGATEPAMLPDAWPIWLLRISSYVAAAVVLLALPNFLAHRRAAPDQASGTRSGPPPRLALQLLRLADDTATLLTFVLTAITLLFVLATLMRQPFAGLTESARLSQVSWTAIVPCGLLAIASLLGYALSAQRVYLSRLLALVAAAAIWIAPLALPEMSNNAASSARPLALLWSANLTLILCAAVIIEGVAVSRMRYRQILTDPSALALPAVGWPELSPMGGVIGICLALLGVYQLIPNADGFVQANRMTFAVQAVLLFAASAAVYFLVNRRWSRWQATVATVLLTSGLCAASRVIAPANDALGSGSYIDGLIAEAIALAIMCIFWCWMAEVWRQQLDNNHPWTTTGKLQQMTRHFATITAFVALALVIIIAIQPMTETGSTERISIARKIFGATAHALLIVALIQTHGRWPTRTKVAAMLVTAASGLVFLAA